MDKLTELAIKRRSHRPAKGGPLPTLLLFTKGRKSGKELPDRGLLVVRAPTLQRPRSQRSR
jgi:hypothetical protein